MKLSILVFAFFLVNIVQFAHSQVQERSVDFSISPGLVMDGELQVAYEWFTPHEFNKTALAIIDQPKLSEIHPGNNHIIANKLAFMSNIPFDNLSYEKMNNAKIISEMLNSISIYPKPFNMWKVTNKVRAYGFPFNVTFDFKLREASPGELANEITKYFKDEAYGIRGTGRERFLIIDMTNFSKLIYRNYSIVYMKEVGPNRTLIVSGLLAAFNIDEANGLFNYPPFATTKGTMIHNLKTQITHMANTLRK